MCGTESRNEGIHRLGRRKSTVDQSAQIRWRIPIAEQLVSDGTSFNGLTALLSMLNSCANGITVVNIDNGYGAAFAACRILRSTVL